MGALVLAVGIFGGLFVVGLAIEIGLKSIATAVDGRPR
jgi:hypothetical protein